MSSVPTPPTPPTSGLGLLPPHLLAIALGGAAGAVARAWVNHAVARAAPDHPYLATFAVNAAGSAVLGALAAWILHRPGHLPEPLAAGLTVGLLGALTTYSTFATDAVKLFRDDRPFTATAYVIGTTALALALAAAAYHLTNRALGQTPTP